MTNCRLCGEFKLHSKNQSWCKDCMKSYMKIWRANNRDKIRAAEKAWKIANPDRTYPDRRTPEYTKNWRETNKDKVKLAYKTWRKANKEQECIRLKVRRAKMRGI